MKSIRDFLGENIESYMDDINGIIGREWAEVEGYDWTDYYPVLDKDNIVEAVIIGEDAPRVAEEYGLEYDEEGDLYRKKFVTV